MPSLSDPQRLVLATAAQRADGALLPLPDQLTVHGRARQLMLQGLIKRGLIVEGRAMAGLEITAAGRALIGSTIETPPHLDDDSPDPAVASRRASGRSEQPAARPGTKQALLIDLLGRRDGATVAEVQDATGWQPHTVRAALTGLRKKSFVVSRASRDDGSRAYVLSQMTTDQDEADA